MVKFIYNLLIFIYEYFAITVTVATIIYRGFLARLILSILQLPMDTIEGKQRKWEDPVCLAAGGTRGGS